MAFGDLTHRPFEQLIREVNKEKGLPLDAGITVKPEDIQVTKDHIKGIREGKIPIPPKRSRKKKK